MPNVTPKSLREAGIPEALWGRAKAICNRKPYTAKRQLVVLHGGPFHEQAIWLDDLSSTAPFRVGDQFGRYKLAAKLCGRFKPAARLDWVAL
jgi:hypothetical protein